MRSGVLLIPLHSLSSTVALRSRQRRGVYLVLLFLRVEARAVDAEEVGRRLLVAARALERALDDELLDLFERHVGRHVPVRSRGVLLGERPVVEGQVYG